MSYFRIAPATIERVQRVLVDGEAVSVVARGDNLTYQPLARTCNKVMDKVEELQQCARAGAARLKRPRSWCRWNSSPRRASASNATSWTKDGRNRSRDAGPCRFPLAQGRPARRAMRTGGDGLLVSAISDGTKS